MEKIEMGEREMTHSAIISKQSKKNQEKAAIPDTAEIIITKRQLRILHEGLCAWNCPAVNLLSNRGRKKLHEAQDLAGRLWKENR